MKDRQARGWAPCGFRCSFGFPVLVLKCESPSTPNRWRLLPQQLGSHQRQPSAHPTPSKSVASIAMTDPSPPYPCDGPEDHRAQHGEYQEATSIPDDLVAIRALLLSLARHNSIEIPREANVLPTTRSLSDVDPKHSRYEEGKTVDYHIRQLPKGSTLESEGNSPLRLDATSLEWGQLAVGISCVLLWTSDLHGPRHDRHVDYDEFSYNGDGHICSLEHRNPQATDELSQRDALSNAPRRREIREHMVSNFLCLHKQFG